MTDFNSLKIYFEDADIIVLEKPSGIVPDGDGTEKNPSLLCLLKNRLKANEDKGNIFCVHRLDKETSGLMVYAKSAEAAASLSEQIRSSRFEKEYVAVIEGIPTDEIGTFEDMLYYDRSKNKSFVVKNAKKARKGVKRASLEYMLLSTDGKSSVVKIKLHTGRTHQIRVQFASRGMPLAADRRYGASPSEQKHFYLHSCKISFYHPKTNEKMEFTSTPYFL